MTTVSSLSIDDSMNAIMRFNVSSSAFVIMSMICCFVFDIFSPLFYAITFYHSNRVL